MTKNDFKKAQATFDPNNTETPMTEIDILATTKVLDFFKGTFLKYVEQEKTRVSEVDEGTRKLMMMGLNKMTRITQRMPIDPLTIPKLFGLAEEFGQLKFIITKVLEAQNAKVVMAPPVINKTIN